MIYNQPFIKIEGEEFELMDNTDRNDFQDIEEGYTPKGEYYKNINPNESFFLPELTTGWLNENKTDNLINILNKRVVIVEGVILSPYFYELNLESKKFHPVLIEKQKSYNLFQVNFELEAL